MGHDDSETADRGCVWLFYLYLAILINMIRTQESGTEIRIGLDDGADGIVCI